MGAIGVLVLALPICGYITFIQKNLQTEILRLKGTRIKILSEVLNGIKVSSKCVYIYICIAC